MLQQRCPRRSPPCQAVGTVYKISNSSSSPSTPHSRAQAAWPRRPSFQPWHTRCQWGRPAPGNSCWRSSFSAAADPGPARRQSNPSVAWLSSLEAFGSVFAPQAAVHLEFASNRARWVRNPVSTSLIWRIYLIFHYGVHIASWWFFFARIRNHLAMLTAKSVGSKTQCMHLCAGAVCPFGASDDLTSLHNRPAICMWSQWWNFHHLEIQEKTG